LAKALNVPRAARTPTTSDKHRAQTPSPQQARVGGASRLKQTQIVVDAREVDAIDVSDDEPTLREIAEPIANDEPPPVLPTSNALIDDDEPTLRRMPEDLDEGR